tara:strand:+ start:333 stop:1349 length:1017 start_codon:yes stop_codon:yes gene_type:complete
MNQREKLNKLRGRNNHEDLIFYSFKKSKIDHINTHELHRLEHSIKSIREFNNEISVYLFCDDPSIIPVYFRTHYSVNVLPFEDGFDHEMLNAWSIHRWYNLKYFKQEANILYVDSDTIFNDDPKYLFDTYCTHQVYGREEFGFKNDPTVSGGKRIREQVDMVDACIYDLGGKVEMYKYCLGVVLLNNVHHQIVDSLNELSELMEQFKKHQVLMPLPNRRIVDEYAVWIIFSRLKLTNGLFGIQDVTQGYLEEKHRETFNPVVLHYTTLKEQKFAHSDPKYANLIRDHIALGKDIDPYHEYADTQHIPQEYLELVAEKPQPVEDDSDGDDFIYEEVFND